MSTFDCLLHDKKYANSLPTKKQTKINRFFIKANRVLDLFGCGHVLIDALICILAFSMFWSSWSKWNAWQRKEITVKLWTRAANAPLEEEYNDIDRTKLHERQREANYCFDLFYVEQQHWNTPWIKGNFSSVLLEIHRNRCSRRRCCGSEENRPKNKIAIVDRFLFSSASIRVLLPCMQTSMNVAHATDELVHAHVRGVCQPARKYTQWRCCLILAVALAEVLLPSFFWEYSTIFSVFSFSVCVHSFG